MKLGCELPWLCCKVETRRLLWLLGFTFAIIITFQYIELPYAISSLFSSSKIPFSRNTTTSHVKDPNFAPAMSPSFPPQSQNNPEVDQILKNLITGKYSQSPGPSLNPYLVKENVTLPVPSTADSPAAPMVRPNVGNVSSEVRFVPVIGEIVKKSGFGVMSIKEMSKELRRSRISHEHQAKKPKWVSKPDLELLEAKYEILNASIDDKDPAFYSPLYRNVSMFKRSYELMEKMLKVYVYKEGNKSVMHNPILNGIYASEGWFMKLIESNNNKFVTKDAAKAHLFYLPFSSRMLELTLYVKDSHSKRNLIEYLKEYIDYIAAKYPYWNRTSGADHFLAACHDWAPSETREYMAKTIRSLCNSDAKRGFIFGKDTSLPTTLVKDFTNPLNNIGGNSSSQRPILAFFAGRPGHGRVRPVLLSYWGNNKDPDLKIFGILPKTKGNKNYLQFMKTSKYCICAKGYEVHSPRVVEAIFYECVPVIISDNYVLPFFEILNWESFAIFVPEKDIPNLKIILMAISDRRYREMQRRVKKVQKHFLWHVKPEKYDMFHMILHSVWFNRVFQVVV